MYRQQRKHRVDSDGIIRTETKWESSLPDIRRKVEDDQQPLPPLKGPTTRAAAFQTVEMRDRQRGAVRRHLRWGRDRMGGLT